MKYAATGRLRRFLYVGLGALTLGLAVGIPGLVAVGAPLLVVVIVGTAVERPPVVAVEARLARHRAIEGEGVILEIELSAPQGLRRLELVVDLPEGLHLGTAKLDHEEVDVEGAVAYTNLPAGQSKMFVELECERWGTYRLDRIELRTRSLVGMYSYRVAVEGPLTLKVFPNTMVIRRLLEPIETRLGFGDLVSRTRGPGFEYADLRPYVPGDDPRSINWRVTARASQMWVTERHPERNADIVFMLDTFAEARRGIDETLDLAVRAVAALIDAHGRRLDRVGLLSFGEPVRWIQPGMGDRHRYRVLDMLMESQLVWQQYWRGLGAVPPRSLPANSLVIGLTPMLEPKMVSALADVRGRGFDVAIIELESERYLPQPRNDAEQVARRIWRLERRLMTDRFMRQGVVVARWRPEDPFPAAVLEAGAFRRRLVRAHV